MADLPTWGEAIADQPAPQLPTWNEAVAQNPPPAMPSLDPEMGGGLPLGGQFDQIFDQTAPGRIAKAFGQGTMDTLNAPLDVTEETRQALTDAGALKDTEEGQSRLAKAFHDAVIRPAAAAAVGTIGLAEITGHILSAPIGGLEAAGTEAYPPLGTAIEAATDPGLQQTLLGAGPAGAIAAGALAMIRHPVPMLDQARSLGVIGEGEAGWSGEGKITEEQVQARQEAIRRLAPAQQVVTAAREAETPLELGTQAPAFASPAPEQDFRVHAVARGIDPDTFQEYDALMDRHGVLTRSLAYNAELRDERVTEGFDRQIAQLQHGLPRLEGEEAETARASIDTLSAERDRALAEAQSAGDSPQMARDRAAREAVDYRMRDLSPQVSAAYRQAAERLGQAPVEAPEPAQEAEPVAAPVAAPAPETATAEPAMAPRVVPDIAADVSQKLVAAGRPAEEADAAASLIEAHYRVRAQRFNGALGTPEQLYAAEGPAIVGADRQLELAQGRTLGQPGAEEPPLLETPEATPEEMATRERQRAKGEAEQRMKGPAVARKPQAGFGETPLGGGKGTQGSLFQARRGAITLRNGQATIRLLANADASTFLHETGHQWLEEMMRDAEDERAPADLIQDARTVRQWLGNEGGAIKTRQHEKFARGFERYLMEGRAPSQALAGIFAKFKQWLTTIYQTVSRLRSPITDDIRHVFDRLITAPGEKPVIAPEPRSFADVHEELADATEPEHAAVVADEVRGQRDEQAHQLPLEYDDARRSRRADEVGRGEAGGRLSDGGRDDRGGPENPEPSRESGTLGAGGGETPPQGRAVPAKSPVFERVPREPQRLVGYLRSIGGVKGDRGDIAATFGRKGSLGGLINNKSGVPLDDAALRAWEAGYFGNREDRPDINDLLDAIHEDVRGKPVYSLTDAREVAEFQDAKARNAEAERLAHEYGLDPKSLTRDQFLSALKEKMSVEEQARAAQEQDEAEQGAAEEAESRVTATIENRGDAWEPDNYYRLGTARSLEDIEREHRQEQAAGQSAQNAGDLERSGRAAGSPSSGQAGAGSRGTGAGARSEQPQRPTDLFGEPSVLVDKAGNIRLDLLNTPEDINAVLRETAAENKDFWGARRGIISTGQTLDLADALGMDPATLDMRKVGQAFNAEEIVGATKLLIQSATKVRDAAIAGDAQTYAEAKIRHTMIQEHVAGITAEAGRALRIFREMKAMPGAEGAKAFGDFLGTQNGRTLFQLEREMKMAASFKTPQQMSMFTNAARQRSFTRMIEEYYVNTLISGPITHARYAAGNALNALWRPIIEKPIAAAIGSITGAEDRVRWGEVGAELYALGKGSRDGLRAAADAFRSGYSAPLPGERAYSRDFIDNRNAIPGVIGEAVRLPGRSVAAIHSFFKALRYEQNKQALAYRMAASEGLDGDSFAARVAELDQHPTPEMMTDASEDALRELYMAPTDYDSAMAGLTRVTNKWLAAKIMVPFLKIGTQITRSAFIDHSPLGFLSQDVRENIAAGGARRDMQLAKITAGTALIGTTVMMAAEGLATGDGPDDPKQRATWLLTHKPNHITIGPISVPYQGLGWLGMLMRASANGYELAHGWTEDEQQNYAAAVMEGIAHSVLDDNWMRGVKDMLDAAYHPAEYGARYIADNVANWMPYSVGMGQVARMIDPYQRRVAGVIDAMKARIPFVSQTLEPKFDSFGQPIIEGGLRPEYQNDPTVRALDALNTGVGRLEDKIRGVKLTEDQFADYSRLAGRYTKLRLDALTRSPTWSQIPEGVRRQTIATAITASREAAAASVMMRSMGGSNDIVKQAVAAKLDRLK